MIAPSQGVVSQPADGAVRGHQHELHHPRRRAVLDSREVSKKEFTTKARRTQRRKKYVVGRHADSRPSDNCACDAKQNQLRVLRIFLVRLFFRGAARCPGFSTSRSRPPYTGRRRGFCAAGHPPGLLGGRGRFRPSPSSSDEAWPVQPQSCRPAAGHTSSGRDPRHSVRRHTRWRACWARASTTMRLIRRRGGSRRRSRPGPATMASAPASR